MAFKVGSIYAVAELQTDDWKKGITTLNTSIVTTQNNITVNLNKIALATKTASDSSVVHFQRIAGAAATVGTSLSKISSVNWSSAFTKLAGAVEFAGSSLLAIGKVALNVGKALGKVLIGGLTLLGNALYDAAQASEVYIKALANVKTITSNADGSMLHISKTLLGMDNALGSATELAQGMYLAMSSGAKDAAEALNVVEVSAMFAKAALVSVKDSVDVLTTAFNAYSHMLDENGKAIYNVNKISDIFFKTVEEGKITGQELAATLGKSIPIYASVGISLEELAAGMATMTRLGVKSRESTTQLNAIVNAFLKPSTAMRVALRKNAIALNDYSLASGATFLKEKQLSGAIEFLTKAAAGNMDKMAAMTRNVRAFRGVLALSINNGLLFKQVLDSINKSAGASKAAFDIQEKTYDTFKNTVSETKILVGNIVNFFGHDMAASLTTIIDKFNNFLKSADGLKLIQSIGANLYANFLALKDIAGEIFSGMDFGVTETGMNVINDTINTLTLSAIKLAAFLVTLPENIKVAFLEVENKLIALQTGIAKFIVNSRAQIDGLNPFAKWSDIQEEQARALNKISEEANYRILQNDIKLYGERYALLKRAATSNGRTLQEQVEYETMLRNRQYSSDVFALKNKFVKMSEKEGEAQARSLGTQEEYISKYRSLNKHQIISDLELQEEYKNKIEIITTSVSRGQLLTVEETVAETKRLRVELQKDLKEIAAQKIPETGLKKGIKDTEDFVAKFKALFYKHSQDKTNAFNTGVESIVYGTSKFNDAMAKAQKDHLDENLTIQERADAKRIIAALEAKEAAYKAKLTRHQKIEYALKTHLAKLKDMSSKASMVMNEGIKFMTDAVLAGMDAEVAKMSKKNASKLDLADATAKTELETKLDALDKSIENYQTYADEQKIIDDKIAADREILDGAELAAAEAKYTTESDLLKTKYANDIAAQEGYDAEKLRLETESAAALEVTRDGILEKQNALAKKAFKTQKALSIASVWMDHAKAVMGFWSAMAGKGTKGWIAAGVASGLNLTTAIAQTKLINDQEFTPAKAEGGMASGRTRVNEEGGEIIKLPDKSLVIPNDISRQIAESSGNGNSGNTINVSFKGAMIKDDMSLDRIVAKVSEMLGRQLSLAR